MQDARLAAMSEDIKLSILATQVGEALKRRGQLLTTAESCTGGWVAQTITSISGSSQWFEAGFVTYSNRIKQQLLGVPANLLEGEGAPGAVSEETVLAMARGAQQRAYADWAIAVSGIAGPGGAVAGKPVGTVWFGWAGPQGKVATRHCQFDGDRTEVRYQSVVVALEGLLALLDQPDLYTG